jgi:hypothetical protein
MPRFVLVQVKSADGDRASVGSFIHELLQFRGFVEKPAMLRDGITVGHPGDVIADNAGPARFAGVGPGGRLRPFGRHQIWGHEKPGKKIANDQTRLIANMDEAVMPIHIC